MMNLSVACYLQGLRRHPEKHPKAKYGDLLLCVLGAGWWLACGIILSKWSSDANNAGLGESHWRAVMCALSWLLFLFFLGMTLMSIIMMSSGFQYCFEKREKKPKKEHHHGHDAAPSPATAAAPAGAPHHNTYTTAPGPDAGLPVSSNAAGFGAGGGLAPATGGAWGGPRDDVPPQVNRV